MRHSMYTMALCCLLALTAFGCADNPADNKPVAEVNEPVADATATAAAPDVVVTEYIITEDSTVAWTGSKVTGKHDGTFEGVSGTIKLAGDTAADSMVDVMIDTTTVTSDNDNLTGHLKSPDFFDVATFPQARFTSTSVTDNGDGTHTISGDLLMHGVTKNITFPATIEIDDDEVSAEAEFSIKRFDWGIEYKGKADDLIRDEVVLKLDIDAEPADSADMADGADMDDEMSDDADS